GEIEGFGRQLAGALGSPAPAASGSTTLDVGDTDAAKWVNAIAKDLQAHRGRSLVVAGEYQPASVHTLARAMNQTLGNVGATVTYGASIEASPTDNAPTLQDLVRAMDAGRVGLVVGVGG